MADSQISSPWRKFDEIKIVATKNQLYSKIVATFNEKACWSRRHGTKIVVLL
jgi:hypothetical protein